MCERPWPARLEFGDLDSDARGSSLRVAGEAVVRKSLPRRGVGDELAVARPDPGIAVERAEADADELRTIRVPAPQRRAARGAEELVVPAGWLVGANELFACGDQ